MRTMFVAAAVFSVPLWTTVPGHRVGVDGFEQEIAADAVNWTFTSGRDGVRAKLEVNAEGSNAGAIPEGFAELVVRAQDEPRDAEGRVLSSSNVTGTLRVQSAEYADRGCRGTQCASSAELIASHSLRLTSHDVLDLVVRNRRALVLGVTDDRVAVFLPDLRATVSQTWMLCIDDTGRVSSRPKC